MKKAFICRVCKQRDEFDTDPALKPLLESREDGSQKEVEFYVDCSHCGAKNVVRVRLPRKP